MNENHNTVIDLKNIIDYLKDEKKTESIEKSKEIIPKFLVKIQTSSFPLNLIYNYVRYQKYLPELDNVYNAYGKNMKDAMTVFPLSMTEPPLTLEESDINYTNDIWSESQKKIFYYNEDLEEIFLVALGKTKHLVGSSYKSELKRKSLGSRS